MKTSMTALIMSLWLQVKYELSVYGKERILVAILQKSRMVLLRLPPITKERMWSHILHLSVQDGNSTAINWSYSDSDSDYFLWYKQEFGRGPQLMIDIRSSVAEKEDQRLTVFLNRMAQHLSCTSQPPSLKTQLCTCCLHSTLCDGCGLFTNCLVLPGKLLRLDSCKTFYTG
ncbi:unnamed protein product [Nyctereutes procyonoides]|uniref:(raccoon dog) hypothetical protein n=1 Tax=Nyctereutes procyonoides TaxID=34880 RepID=A0A811XW70_NYCPR|nr:unnamed protein product [Nyctereutes procyonoides]